MYFNEYMFIRFAAALISATQFVDSPVEDGLRIGFDLDAVLFSDDSEKRFQELLAENKLTAVQKWEEYEEERADDPMREGPLKKFAESIGKMQKEFLDKGKPCPIKTYIITARGVGAGKRALRTLESWSLIINETFLRSGQPKDKLLAVIKPHIYFDDSKKHIDGAKEQGVPAGHVRKEDTN